MNPRGQISPLVAIIAAAATIVTGAFTAYATSSARANQVDTKVEVLQERQALQYTQLNTEVQALRTDVKEILKAVK